MKKIMLYELFNQISNLTPMQRLSTLAAEGIHTPAEKTLLCLYTMNECIQKTYHTQYYFYVMNDRSVSYVLNQSENTIMTEKDFFYAVNLLDISKLLYRFPCAKKFRVENPAIYQLRINSWGREYCEDVLLGKYPLEHKQLAEIIQTYLEDNNHIYKELTNRLLLPINQENAQKIQDLNKNVRINLLS